MNILIIVSLICSVTFFVGILCGATWAEQVMSARSRRQAIVQRELNCQRLAIRNQLARLEFLRDGEGANSDQRTVSTRVGTSR